MAFRWSDWRSLKRCSSCLIRFVSPCRSDSALRPPAGRICIVLCFDARHMAVVKRSADSSLKFDGGSAINQMLRISSSRCHLIRRTRAGSEGGKTEAKNVFQLRSLTRHGQQTTRAGASREESESDRIITTIIMIIIM